MSERRRADGRPRRGTVMTVHRVDQPVNALRRVLTLLSDRLHTNRWIVCIAPPFRLTRELIRGVGLDVGHCRVAYPSGEWGHGFDVIEYALRCTANALVLAWPRYCDTADMSRLQDAAQEGGTVGVLFFIDPTLESRTADADPERRHAQLDLEFQ